MTFDDLTTTTADFKHAERVFLDGYLPTYNRDAIEQAADITEIALDDAKKQLLRDICDEAGLSPDDADDLEAIDTVIDREQDRFKRALALQQMVQALIDRDEGPESANGRFLKSSEKSYTDTRKRFASLFKGRATSTARTFPVRM